MDLVAAPGARAMGARHGRALFCDVTIVFPITRNGDPASGARIRNGASLRRAENRKRNTNHDVLESDVAELLVLGAEVYGRWNKDALDLIRELVALKADEVPGLLRGSAANAWRTRWWNLLSVGTQRACSEVLLCGGGADLLPQPECCEDPSLARVFT